MVWNIEMTWSIQLTERMKDWMLKTMEPLDQSDALEIAIEEGLEDMEPDLICACLSRAKFYVLGELVANEYETPDSERMLDHGYTREKAISDWVKMFTVEN